MEMQEIGVKKQTQIFCIEHKGRAIKYLNLDDNRNENISSYPLACYVCHNNNKANNLYVPIEEILENDDDQTILNWPRGINKNCKEFLESHSKFADNDLNDLRKNIIQFYDDMTETLVSQIREQKKQNLVVVDQYELKNNELFNFYNQAFRRIELKQQFSNMNNFQCERYYEFLRSLEETRQKDLDLLEVDIQWLAECEKNLKKQSKQQLIMKEQIEKLISELNIYQQNNNSINFSALSQSKMDLIKEVVNHSIILGQENSILMNSRSNNNSHIQCVENSMEYQYFEQILESNLNFINPNLKDEIKEFIKETYPFLKKVNFTNACANQERFDYFRKLTESDIEDLYRIIQKRQELNDDSKYNLSLTKLVEGQTRIILEDFNDVGQTFRKYPIFDLLTLKQKKLCGIKLTKTSYNDGIDRIVITDNEQVSFNQSYKGNKIFSVNCVSDASIEREKKYIFRFKINYLKSSNAVFFGLISNNKCDSQQGYSEKLCCRFVNENSEIVQDGNYGVETYLRGDKMRLRGEEKEIEMRVWLRGQQLQVLDYPNYDNLITLKNKEVLSNMNDLKLYIGLQHKDQRVILTYQDILDNFPN